MGCSLSSVTGKVTARLGRYRDRKQIHAETKVKAIWEKDIEDITNDTTTMEGIISDSSNGTFFEDPQLDSWGYGESLMLAIEHTAIERPRSPPPPEIPKLCVSCVENLNPPEGNPLNRYSCPRCGSPYCIPCLKSMFLSACKDESRMPPQCCKVIQLNVALPHLSEEEASLYRAKYEEWITPNRLYCPVPTCSAFIPRRLLPSLPTKPSSEDNQRISNPLDNPEITTGQMSSNTQDLLAITNCTSPEMTVIQEGSAISVEERQEPIQKKDTRIPEPSMTETQDSAPSLILPSVSCPQCYSKICLSCKQLDHTGKICPPDLDPYMAKLLKKWKIKRCPRCQAGVKRMFGCAHMRCHCGAQWCWHCLQPIQICNQDCSGESPEDATVDAGEEAQLEDLDGVNVIDEQVAREQYDFGQEPNQDDLVPWNCEHYWVRLIDKSREQLECQQCWRQIFSELDEKRIKSVKRKRLRVAITKEAIAWVCHCGMVVCSGCAVQS